MFDAFFIVFQNNLLFRSLSLLVLGAVIGSFLNVIIYRVPLILQQKWLAQSAEVLQIPEPERRLPQPFNLFIPASHCPACFSPVPLWANVPLFGYFFTRGRCKKCKARISLRYPLIELITAVFFVCAGIFVTDLPALAAVMVFICCVLCLIFIDYDTFILPDEITLPLMWLGIVVNLNGMIAGSLKNSVMGAVTGYLSLWLIYWGFKLLTRRDGMGYGDFKFLAALLAWVGYQGFIPITLIASALGIVYYIFQRLFAVVKPAAGLNHEIPFGPFLGGAGILFIFCHNYFSRRPNRFVYLFCAGCRY